MPLPVLIAGGGPVGLMVAVILGQANIDAILCDAGDIIHGESRAATILTPTLDLLDEYGAYKDVEKLGTICPIVHYYDRQELIGVFDHGLLAGETTHPWVLQCEQNKLVRVLAKMLRDLPSILIHTGAKVAATRQDEDSVEITVQRDDGTEGQFRGSYLIAADGSKSTVRDSLGIAFEGETLPERFMSIGTLYDFMANDGYADRNYISDPEEWYNLFKIPGDGPPGISRLIVPIGAASDRVSPEQKLVIAQQKIQRFHPRIEPYELTGCRTYVVDQRVAPEWRRGRILLAGDAAHLNSPIGAMGMNSGLHDAVSLARNLLRVLRGTENDGALDRYVRQRRHVAIDHVQRASKTNKRHMEQRDAVERRDYRDTIIGAARDKAVAKQFLMKTSLIESLRDAEQIA
jgi:3-(3-hydroxy-phenyl)propionate hydroxylase